MYVLDHHYVFSKVDAPVTFKMVTTLNLECIIIVCCYMKNTCDHYVFFLDVRKRTFRFQYETKGIFFMYVFVQEYKQQGELANSMYGDFI